MTSPLRLSLSRAILSGVFLFFVSTASSARATPAEPFAFENADIQAVAKHVAAVAGITLLFDPEQVKGKITLLSQSSVSPTEALELLKSALALHGYTLIGRPEGTWIVPAQHVRREAFTVRVIPLSFAEPGELAYTLSWVAPPTVRIVPYYPTNSLIISGDPAAVDELFDIIK